MTEFSANIKKLKDSSEFMERQERSLEHAVEVIEGVIRNLSIENDVKNKLIIELKKTELQIEHERMDVKK